GEGRGGGTRRRGPPRRSGGPAPGQLPAVAVAPRTSLLPPRAPTSIHPLDSIGKGEGDGASLSSVMSRPSTIPVGWPAHRGRRGVRSDAAAVPLPTPLLAGVAAP